MTEVSSEVTQALRPEGCNGAITQAVRALRYLAEHDRPSNGEQFPNSAACHQVADELEQTLTAFAPAIAAWNHRIASSRQDEVREADVENIARLAMAGAEIARTDVVKPVNGTAPYTVVIFQGQRIEFHDGEWTIAQHRDAGSSKAAAYAQAINGGLFEVAKRAASNGNGADERQRIVAWLRSKDEGTLVGWRPEFLADLIERGEHVDPDLPATLSDSSTREESGADALSDIAAERRRQIEAEGWTPAHDDEHADAQMAGAAACYAMSAIPHWAKHEAIRLLWPWSKAWWKPRGHRENLVRAGALIVAEIERIDRAALFPEGGE